MNWKDSFELRAVIFDMDGVLIDSEKHWLTQGRDLVARWIPGWTDEKQAGVAGLSGRPLFEFLCRHHGLEASEEAFLEDYNESIREIYTIHARLIDGVVPLLDEISASNLKLALATSSPRKWIDVVAGRFGFQKWFDLMVSATDFGCRAKPAPDIYFGTAGLLSVCPPECLVVEDSAPGIAAARDAGMKVVGLRNGFNEGQDLSCATSMMEGLVNSSLVALTKHFDEG